MHLLPSTNAGVIPSLGSGLENLEDLDLEDGWCQICSKKDWFDTLRLIWLPYAPVTGKNAGKILSLGNGL